MGEVVSFKQVPARRLSEREIEFEIDRFATLLNEVYVEEVERGDRRAVAQLDLLTAAFAQIHGGVFGYRIVIDGEVA